MGKLNDERGETPIGRKTTYMKIILKKKPQ